VISGANGVGVVLDNENRVAEISKGFEDVDEALRVARMKTDRRFIQNV
jgi:hypothetical protein